MTATKTLFNFSDYERTYNFAVDLVAQTVGFHRKNFSPLKAIYLNKKILDRIPVVYDYQSGRAACERKCF